MMQNFGLEDLSHVQSRPNLLKYLVRVEMASDWFTRIYRTILAEQISSKIEILRANLVADSSWARNLRNENQIKVNTVLIGTKFGNINGLW